MLSFLCLFVSAGYIRRERSTQRNNKLGYKNLIRVEKIFAAGVHTAETCINAEQHKEASAVSCTYTAPLYQLSRHPNPLPILSCILYCLASQLAIQLASQLAGCTAEYRCMHEHERKHLLSFAPLFVFLLLCMHNNIYLLCIYLLLLICLLFLSIITQWSTELNPERISCIIIIIIISIFISIAASSFSISTRIICSITAISTAT